MHPSPNDDPICPAALDLERVLMSVGEYVWIAEMSEDGPVIPRLHSAEVENLTGYSAERLQHEPGLWHVLAHPDDRQVRTDLFARARSAGLSTQSANYRILRADGSLLCAAETIHVFPVSQDRWHLIGVVRPASSQTAAATIPLEVKDLPSAPSAGREYGSLNASSRRLALAGACLLDELSDPLGGMLLAAQVAQRFGTEPDRAPLVRRCLDDVVRHCLQCARVLKATRQLCQPEPRPQWLSDLNEVVSRSAASVRPLAEQRGVRVDLILCPSPIMRMMNPLELELAVSAVLRRAVLANGQPPLVVVETAADADAVRILIINQGSAASSSPQKNVLAAWERAAQGEEGAHAGLAFSQLLIESQGGRLRAENNFPSGTIAIIELSS